MSITRIHSKGDFRQEEADAGEAGIYPGMLVCLNSSGDLVKHANEGGRAERALAMEDALQGKTVDDVYTSGNVATYGLFVPGSEGNALIKAGSDLSIGTELISDGAGRLIPLADISSGETADQIIAISMADLDLTGTGDEDTLSPVRFL